jgi:hypothetical protein
MNAKAALCLALLKGEVVSIRTGFMNLGITNVPREIGRSIEREDEHGFGVIVSRTHKKGKSRHGVPCSWTEYRLNKSEHNLPGIEKMKAYVKDNIDQNPKTDRDFKQLKQLSFL